MAQTPNIRPFIIDTIIQTLRSVFNDSFKEYYFGDPIDIPDSLMPCLIISKESGDVSFGPTGMDENTETILIQVIFNKKDEIGNPSAEVFAHRRLMEVIEGRDATTGFYLDNSIMGVLRKNATLGNLIVNQVASPEYSTALRGEDTFVEEATIRLSVTAAIPAT